MATRKDGDTSSVSCADTFPSRGRLGRGERRDWMLDARWHTAIEITLDDTVTEVDARWHTAATGT